MAIDQAIIGQEYHNNDSLKNFNSVDDMAKSYIELKSMQGHSVRLPSENASDADVTAFNESMSTKLPNWMLKPDFENGEQSGEFWSKLGVPSEAGKYEIPDVQIPEGMEAPNADKLAYMQNLAKEANLTPAQFKSVMTKIMTTEIEGKQAMSEAKEQAAKDIKAEWGQAHEERMGIALKAAEATGAPESVVNAVKDGTAGVETMTWMYKVGMALGDEGRDLMDNLKDKSGKKGLLSPEEAQRQLDEIHANSQHPYYTARGDEKKRATDAYVALMKQAHPTASTEM